MIGALTQLGVTVLMTASIPFVAHTEIAPLPAQDVSFLTDGLIALRFVERDAQLRRALCVVKLRSSGHSKHICAYDIGDNGFMLEPLP